MNSCVVCFVVESEDRRGFLGESRVVKLFGLSYRFTNGVAGVEIPVYHLLPVISDRLSNSIVVFSVRGTQKSRLNAENLLQGGIDLA